MDITPEMTVALATARLALRKMGPEPMDRYSALYMHYAQALVEAVTTLDDAGVFAALDEHTDYAAAEDIMQSLQMPVSGPVDEPLYGAAADRARDGLEDFQRAARAIDALRPKGSSAPPEQHTHVFHSPHSDELCYGDPRCTVTYAEHRRTR